MTMEEKGIISKETSRVLLGIENPALEKERVDTEKEEELDNNLRIANKLNGFTEDEKEIESSNPQE